MHCKTRWIYHLHGLFCSLLGNFLSWQLWWQLLIWVECSGECRYVQDQLFYTMISVRRLSSMCFPMGIHYNTTPHLLNRKSLHCGFSVSAKGHRIVDLLLPSTSQGMPQDNGDLQIDSRLRRCWLLQDDFSEKPWSWANQPWIWKATMTVQWKTLGHVFCTFTMLTR